ncbi:TerB family tellurite resistance protein [Carboxylicivirga sp. A043]|uniref:TerB family tellurite resistance protein n=1 Tax=Carboxylicivirga litoralis TaxID=2816963 RepID=UPI0021CAE5C0|nr:TerB family tellurite resistance protein [Carboxylicivirga sp. A043]MCU4158006.1 TerB family tellurite resistance protein [Carboxylicivirga sp. A043]
MGLLGSFIGAQLGWWTLGPIGAILGLVFGHITEEQASFIKGKKQSAQQQSRSGFLATLLVLVAAVMKADGRVVKSELDYVKRSLVATFGEEEAGKALLMLRDILNQNIPVNDVLHQARVNINYSSKVQLLHLLFGIALADGTITADEQRFLRHIASGLGLSSQDFESVSAMFIKSTSSAYKTLEVENSATDEEVKKAYKKMAIRFHPDKVAHLGEDIRKDAEARFKKINDAYMQIKKERGLK